MTFRSCLKVRLLFAPLRQGLENHHSSASCYPHLSVVLDTVDMSQYESSFRGLTGPSKAGLALAVMLSAAMVAASPELSVSSFSLDPPATWLGSLQQDSIPLLTEKLDMMASTLSPQVQATQAAVMDNVAKGLDMLEAQSYEWQNSFQQLQAQTQTLISEMGNSISTQSSSWWSNGLSNLATFSKSFTGEAQQIPSQVASRMEEYRQLVVPSIEQGLKDMEATVSDLRASVEQTSLDDKIALVREQTETYLAYQNREMVRLGIEPAMQAVSRFWDSFESEAIREFFVVKEASEDMVSQLTTATHSMVQDVQDFKDSRLPEMSQKAVHLLTEKQDYLHTEVSRFQGETLPALAKTVDSWQGEARGIISDYQMQLERAGTVLVEKVTSTCLAVADDLRSMMEQFFSQARSNLIRWRDLTASGVAQQKLTYIQIYDSMNSKANAAVNTVTQKEAIVRDVVLTKTTALREAVRALIDDARF